MSLIHKFYLVEINDFNLLNYEIIYNRLIEKNKTERILDKKKIPKISIYIIKITKKNI